MEISLKRVSSGYEESVIQNLDLDIKAGTWNFITGSTGSGKSTLLSTIAVLLKSTAGTILWKGKDLSILENLKEYRDNSGFMFQYTEKQFFNSTIREEIVYSLQKKRIPEEEIEVRLKSVLETLSISEDILDRSPYELSGGQKRFVAFASVLINSPNILLLDEPTAGLDLEKKQLFFNILKNLRDSGVTIIQISHLLQDVLEYGDNVIQVDKGKIIASGNPLDVLKDSDSDFLKFCKVMEKYGVKSENSKSIDQFLKGLENYEKR
ncbi:MAG: energy-coupling factor ABC transporter ATP-binding protein [Cetobacterium sp.]